jgi:tetratricopeptide (TPR) repeat protein
VIHSELTPHNNHSSKTKYFYWVIAATTLIFSLLFSWFIFSKPTPEKLFSEHFQTYQSISTFGGEEQPMDKAMDFYNSGRYAEAINAMEAALVNDAYNLSQYHFYLGVSYLANNNPDKAIANFRKTLSADNDFVQQSKWYLALAFLKKGDKEETKKLLQEISSMNAAYKQKEAAEILKDLF